MHTAPGSGWVEQKQVNSWGYGFENWVYVVLSRVQTRLGLFLNKKLDLKKKFKVPEKLLTFENRMKVKEREYLKEFHNFEEDMQTN